MKLFIIVMIYGLAIFGLLDIIMYFVTKRKLRKQNTDLNDIVSKIIKLGDKK